MNAVTKPPPRTITVAIRGRIIRLKVSTSGIIVGSPIPLRVCHSQIVHWPQAVRSWQREINANAVPTRIPVSLNVPKCQLEDLVQAMEAVHEVHVSKTLTDYTLELVERAPPSPR